MTALIARDDSRLQIAFTAAANELKEHALETAGLIGRVTNPTENERAVAAQTELNNLVKLVEKARKEAKDPVLTFGRQIDEAAKQFVEEAHDELLRVSRLLGDFATLEQAKVRAAEAARRLEEEKLEAARKAEEQRIIDAQRAEKAKLDADAKEASARLQAAKNEEQREAAKAAQIEIDKQKAISQAASHEALDAVNAHFNRQAADLPVVTAVRAEGQIIKSDWDIEVTDIWLLARSHRSCVDMKPRLSEIKELLRLGVNVKGITATQIVSAGVRAGAQRKAIEV